MKSVKIYNCADIYSDHNSFVFDFRFKGFLKVEGKQITRKVEIEQLKNQQQREDVEGTGNALKTKIKIQKEEIGLTKNKPNRI